MKREKLFILLYFLFALIFLGKEIYYTEKIAFVPDEPAHVSYVVYMADHPEKWIPDYEDMFYAVKPTEDPGLFRAVDIRGNYLGHASLYYKLMAMSGQVKASEGGREARIHIRRLRYLNVALVLLGLLLYYYIGYTRIPRNQKRLGSHVFYAAVTGGVPMMAFLACGITNDNLLYLTFGLFLLGILRYTEGKENLGTYMLIALGLSATTLTKLTSGMVTVTAAVLFLAADMRRKRHFLVVNRSFWWTVPVYGAAIAYYAAVYIKYKALLPGLQQLNPDYFYSSNWYIPVDQRPALTKGQLWKSYWQTLSDTWTGIYNGKFFHGKALWSLSWWPFILILLFALAGGAWQLLRTLRKKKERQVKEIWMPAVLTGFLLTLAVNLGSAFATFRDNGRVGGIQARYYVFLAPVFALAGLSLWERPEGWLKQEAERGYNRVLNICLILFSLWFLWADFPYTWFKWLRG